MELAAALARVDEALAVLREVRHIVCDSCGAEEPVMSRCASGVSTAREAISSSPWFQMQNFHRGGVLSVPFDSHNHSCARLILC